MEKSSCQWVLEKALPCFCVLQKSSVKEIKSFLTSCNLLCVALGWAAGSNHKSWLAIKLSQKYIKSYKDKSKYAGLWISLLRLLSPPKPAVFSRGQQFPYNVLGTTGELWPATKRKMPKDRISNCLQAAVILDLSLDVFQPNSDNHHEKKVDERLILSCLLWITTYSSMMYNIYQGWSNLLNLTATYNKFQIFNSHKRDVW